MMLLAMTVPSETIVACFKTSHCTAGQTLALNGVSLGTESSRLKAACGLEWTDATSQDDSPTTVSVYGWRVKVAKGECVS